LGTFVSFEQHPEPAQAVAKKQSRHHLMTNAPFNHLHFPEIESAANHRLLINQGIVFVEQMFSRQQTITDLIYRPDESASLDSWREKLKFDSWTRHAALKLIDLCCRHPKLSRQMTQARTVWQWLHRRHRVIVFCRELSPVATMVFQMCQRGRSNQMPRIISGWMNETHFGKMLNAAGRLVNAPLRICDTREPGTFLTVLPFVHRHFDQALCDWTLSAEEKAEAHRLTHSSPIQLWCP
jgi:hypothetical protein